MRLILLTLLLVFATPALATDGVLEINQTCAVETGCFPGDAPGLPVTITQPGSYRLTSNLIVPDENTDGIAVRMHDVSVDLNGFEIAGPVVCTTDPVVCAPAGSGSGVETNVTSIEGVFGFAHGVSVTNGIITGMGFYGVQIGGPNSQATNLRVRRNRAGGIGVGSGSTVLGNTAYQNGDHGIIAGNGSTVSGNTAYQNGDDGIRALSGSTVSGNTARSNAGRGIFADSASTIEGNTVVENGGNGIQAETGSTVRGNTAQLNLGSGIEVRFGSHVVDNTVFNNGDGEATDDGISCLGGCTISRNTARSNSGYGIRAGTTETSFSENTVSNNTTGTVLSGRDAGGNVCNGSLTCP